MLFAFTCIDKAGASAVRLENREKHLAYLQRHQERIVFAGPFVSDDGQAMLGSLLVLEFDDRLAAEAFAAGDPYAQAGLFAEVKITAVRKVLPK